MKRDDLVSVDERDGLVHMVDIYTNLVSVDERGGLVHMVDFEVDCY